MLPRKMNFLAILTQSKQHQGITKTHLQTTISKRITVQSHTNSRETIHSSTWAK